MIKIEIILSSDPLAIGIYDYLFDKIFIGRSKKCDLIFLEKEFPLCYLTLTIDDGSLLVDTATDGPSYFINGKKIKGLLRLKINDIIQIGSHQIKILEFKNTHQELDLTPFYEQISSAPEEVQSTLSILENALVAAEETNNV